jgi:CHAT domain-containing protein
VEYLSNLHDVKENLAAGTETEDNSILEILPRLRVQVAGASASETANISSTRCELAKPSISVRQKLILASSLRNIFDARFANTGSVEFLNPAIEAAEMAKDAASIINIPRPLKNLVQADASYDLGMLLWERRRALHEQDIEGLNYTIKCLDEADSIKHSRRQETRLNSLSGALSERWEKRNDVNDLHRSLSMAFEALQLVPQDDTLTRPGLLLNYASKLRALSYATSEEELLDKAKLYTEKALEALPDPVRDPRWPKCKSEIASILLRKYSATGDTKYLNEGIECCYAVAEIMESSDALFPEYYGRHWDTLAGLLRLRYDRFEVKEDLTAAVDAAIAAVKSLPLGHKQLGLRLNNLSQMYWRRFSRLLDPEDIDKAITAATQAVSVMRDASLHKGTVLSTLSGLLQERFKITKNVADVDESISKAAQAAEESPGDNLEHLVNRNNLARAFLFRASLGGVDSLAYMDRAINVFQYVVNNTQADHPDRASRLGNLGGAFEQRYAITSLKADFNAAVVAFDQCSQCIHGSPLHRTHAAARAAHLHLSRQRFTEADSLLRRAVSLLRNVSPRILQQRDQQHVLRRFADLATLATSVALEAATTNAITADGDAADDATEDALSLLEDGRGIILGLLFEIRSDVAVLRKEHPDLAARFERLRDELDAPAISQVPGSMAIQPPVALTRREKLVEEFDGVVDWIRRLKGFDTFLKAPDVAKMRNLVSPGGKHSDTGIVVVINVSKLRSDAFIVQADRRVRQLQLPGLQLESIKKWVVLLKSGKITKAQMFELLEWLWNMLASPVLSHIKTGPQAASGSSHPCGPNRHRIWWIPTGPLSLLPIHAAGRYTSDGHSSSSPFVSLLDSVVSSYSPSIKALLFSKRAMSQTADNKESARHEDSKEPARHEDNKKPARHRPLLISMRKTPGCRTLQHAKREVEAVQQSLSALRLTQNSNVERESEGSDDSPVVTVLHEPDKAAVLAGLRAGATIVHFAGHGRSDLKDPLQSALLVKDWKDDLLTVKDLISLKLHENGNKDHQRPFLAYLSACSTGSNRVDDLLDEGLHLMSACQLAGFQHVVGSLWAVSDRHCVDVARAVFASVGATVSTGGEQMVAISLQEGVIKLRDQGWVEARVRHTAHAGDEPREDKGNEHHSQSSESDSEGEDQGIIERAGYAASGLATKHYSIKSDPRIWAAYIHIGL